MALANSSAALTVGIGNFTSKPQCWTYSFHFSSFPYWRHILPFQNLACSGSASIHLSKSLISPSFPVPLPRLCSTYFLCLITMCLYPAGPVITCNTPFAILTPSSSLILPISRASIRLLAMLYLLPFPLCNTNHTQAPGMASLS